MRYLILTTFLFGAHLAGWAGPAFAQNKDASPTDRSIELREAITEKLDRFLLRYLDKSAFSVAVQVAGDTARKDLPYVPGSSTPYRSLLLEQLLQSVSELSVTLALSSRVSADSRKSLETLVIQKLSTSSLTPKVETITFDLEIEERDTSTLRQIQQLQQDLRQTEFEKEQLARERNDLKTELLAKDSAIQEKAAEPNSQQDLLHTILDQIPLAIIAILIMITAFLALARMSKSINTIGGGIESLATSVSNFAARGADDSASEESADENDEPQASTVIESGKQPDSGTDIEERLKQISEEISSLYNEQTSSIYQSLLSGLLSKRKTKARAVALLELLSNETSNQLFEKLPQDLQLEVSDFLESGNFGTDKKQLMLSVGEELQTRLLQSRFGKQRGELNSQGLSKAAQLTVENCLALVERLEDESLARFSLYLTPAMVNEMLIRLKAFQPEQLMVFMTALKESINATSAVNLDEQWIPQAEALIEEGKTQQFRQHALYFERLLKRMTPDLKEQVLPVLSESSDEIGSYLAESVLTFDRIFDLAPESLEALLAKIANKDLAYLWEALGDQTFTPLAATLTERRRNLISEEKEELSDSQRAKLKSLAENAKANVIKHMEVMLEQGTLSLKARAEKPNEQAA